MSKKPPPINLDKYLEDRKHKYATYEAGAIEYGLPYWTFVKIAKEANATWALRKTAMVDLRIFEEYLETFCDTAEDADELIRKRGNYMAYKRKQVDKFEALIGKGKKKYVRYAEGAELYSMGIHSFEQLAKNAHAIRRVKGIVLINTEKVDEFIESFSDVEEPVLVRPDDEGTYEMVSGHRRLRAAKKAGIRKIPAIIKEMTDDVATIAMVDANVQREEIFPSEKALLKLEEGRENIE